MRRNSCFNLRTVVAFVCLVSAGAGAAQAGDIPWRHNLNRAAREAKRRGRPIFVQVSSPNCVWCQRMENSTLQHPEVCRLLTERFIAVKVDGSEDRDTVQQFAVRSYPTLLFAHPDGTVLQKQVGYLDTRELVRRLQETLDQVETESKDSEEKPGGS
jgi:thioredoxin-related protein